MHFPKLILTYGLLLVFLSLLFHYLAGVKDIALLTPLIFGGFILIMAAMSIKPELGLFARHGATAVSLVAFAVSVPGIISIFSNVEGLQAYIAYNKAIMAVLSIAFIGLAVQQFANERAQNEKNDAVE